MTSVGLHLLRRKESIYFVGMIALGSGISLIDKLETTDFHVFFSGCFLVLFTTAVAESFGR
ncbi:hypothetical protein [Bdellovibrio sp. KM01]|uniref:hypothetical protein n=1 Tax=Bdellovibrio sp. KM01 TaxID=2748865 RepID=UPI0015E8FFBB|nr:hypothetical protein [Bdellovibrio sp. KM01]QLY23854.1 hypothetical protein HW988_10135 [Bdellovibrio sp. KM01]